MKVITAFPPNIEKIEAALGKNPPESCVIYTYGDTIYDPHGGSIDPYLMIHEETHTQQQGSDPEGWWDRYLVDIPFRLEMELQAYRKQYRAFAKGRDRNIAFIFLNRLARDLSSSIYGNIISHEKAIKLIRC